MNEFITKVKNGELDIVEHTHQCIADAKKLRKKYHYFNYISEELAIQQAEDIKNNPDKFKKGKLVGVMISVKDSICVKGVESTAGSRILKGYTPLMDATVVERVKKEGGIILGKTAQDEFGFGSFSVNVGLGYSPPKNPFDPERSCGGSSGGAAGLAQKADFPHISIGESTGGSIAEPASFCGVFGLTPTYGRNSRYGLIDFGNSLDKIGPMGKTITDLALLQDSMSGYDPKDSTSLEEKPSNYHKTCCNSPKGMKVGIIKETFTKEVDEKIQKHVHAGIEKLKDAGVSVEEINLAFPLKYSMAVYYMIGTSEASTNLAKYCGMRYGHAEKLEGNFNAYFTKVRSMHLSEEAKRRIIMGTFARMSGYRDAYYIKAAKVRTLIIQEYKKAFQKYDAVLSPTAPVLPPTFKEIEKLTPLQNYMMDLMLTGPNVAGLPHLNVPVGFEGKLPVGMLLTGDHLQEEKLLQLGSVFE